MIRLLAVAGFTAMVAACAAPGPDSGHDPMHDSRGSTYSGASKAEALGFHGPVHRGGPVDGAN